MTNPIDDPTASPAVKGEKDIGGSTQDPEIDDDIDVMIEDVLGKQPKPGQTFNDLINEAEKIAANYLSAISASKITAT